MAFIINCIDWPNWKDFRIYELNEEGEKRVFLGGVTNLKTKDVFCSLSKDTNEKLSQKFNVIVWFTLPLGLVLTYAGFVSLPVGLLLSVLGVCRAASRVLGILSGDFIESAHRTMRAQWLQRRLEWSRNPSISEPTKKDYLRLIYLRAFLIELPKNLFKLATIPIQMAALSCAALYGVCIRTERGPLDGMWFVSKIEQLWSRDRVFAFYKDCYVTTSYSEEKGRKIECLKTVLDVYDCLNFSYITFSEMMPCMQPMRIFNERNLFAITHVIGEFEGHIGSRSMLNAIEQKLKRHEAFWKVIFKDATEGLMKEISYYRRHARVVSQSDSQDLKHLITLKRVKEAVGNSEEEVRLSSLLTGHSKIEQILTALTLIEDHYAGFGMASADKSYSERIAFDAAQVSVYKTALNDAIKELNRRFPSH